MAQHVQIKVVIGGKKISPISYCSINQTIDWHHSFEVLIPMDTFKAGNTILDQAKNYLGERIEISFAIVSPVAHDEKNLFIGLVTDVSLSRRNVGNKEVLIRGNSPTVLLDGKPNCKAYGNDVDLGSIVNDLQQQISHNDLTIQSNIDYSGNISYIVQYKESNYHFLNRIADKYGQWCFYNGQELIFGAIDKSKVTKLPIDKNLTDFEFSMQIENLNYKGITYDYMKNETYKQDTNDISVNDLDLYGDHALKKSEEVFSQIPVFYSPGLFKDESEFDRYTENKKYALTKDLIVASGTSDNPYINVGSVIEVTGESRNETDFGQFIVTSITHSIDISGNYTNHFTSIPSEASIETYNKNVGMPLAETQPAVVTDNKDPDKLGRVKVKYYWQDGDESANPWIRMLNTHAGKEHGFYFIPEIDDEVMVGFENDNPDKPYVLGHMYHKNTSPDHWYNDDNNLKSIRTRNGNQIILNDEDGKEEIRILNPDDGDPTNEISLSLDGNGKITIKSVGDLEINAENIRISANTDFSLDVGQNTKFTTNEYSLEAQNGIEVKGTNIVHEASASNEITAGADLKLQADANAELKAGANADIKANANATLEGSVNAEVKGGATTKVSGNGSAELSSGGNTTVKGTMVMIN